MAITAVDLKEIKGFGLADLVVLGLLVALVIGLAALTQQWGSPYQPTVEIDLAPSSLLGYSLLSLARGFAAYILSLAVTFWWALWAARSKWAERVLIPLVDILQSIPVLGFMPGLVLVLVRLFPNSSIGLELAGIVLIFTSQAWNMILAFYQSIKTVPQELREAAELSGLSASKRFFSLELPSGMNVLAWNSMMSMAGGWFFLTASEAFQLGSQDFRLPGLGSYMSVAMDQGNIPAMGAAVLAMAAMVVAVDQLLWRPLLAWSFKFRLEDTPEAQAPRSWLFDLLVRSRALRAIADMLSRRFLRWLFRQLPEPVKRPIRSTVAQARGLRQMDLLNGAATVAFAVGVMWGSWGLLQLLRQVEARQWAELWGLAGLTLLRTLGAVLLGTLWALPLGVMIGMNPRLSRVMQPVIQMTASFPAPMIFPALLVVLFALGISLNWAAVVLMMTGTAWYILFNTIAGASAIPQEQREAWKLYGPAGWARWRRFLVPSLLPSLLVGWETAMGGAWNASILTEYFRLHGATHTALGLGAAINTYTERGDFAHLAAAVLVMVLIVVALNRLFWHRLYDYAARLQGPA